MSDLLDDFINTLKTVKPFGIYKELSFTELKKKKIINENSNDFNHDVDNEEDANYTLPEKLSEENILNEVEVEFITDENNDFFEESESEVILDEKDEIFEEENENIDFEIMLITNDEFKDKAFVNNNEAIEEEKDFIENKNEYQVENKDNEDVVQEGYSIIETETNKHDEVLRALTNVNQIEKHLDDKKYEKFIEQEEKEKEILLDGSNIPIDDNNINNKETDNSLINEKSEIDIQLDENIEDKVLIELENNKNRFLNKLSKKADITLDELIKENAKPNKNKKNENFEFDEDELI